MAESFTATIRNTLPALARLQRDVAAFLAEYPQPGDTAYAIELAVEELVSNVIRHGYDDGGDHDIHVSLELRPGSAELVIDDDGRPFDPNDHPEPSVPDSWDSTPVGGRGILLVKRMAGPLHYAYVGGRNVVTLRISR